MLKAIRRNALSSWFGIGNSDVCLITFSMSNYLIHMITNIKPENRRGAQRGPAWAATQTHRETRVRANVCWLWFSSVIPWRFLLATGALWSRACVSERGDLGFWYKCTWRFTLSAWVLNVRGRPFWRFPGNGGHIFYSCWKIFIYQYWCHCKQVIKWQHLQQ